MSFDGDVLFESDRFYIQRACHQRTGQPLLHRDIVRHPGSVVIVPMVDTDHVCMIRNYRVSVQRKLWELPAGTREPDESLLSTAHRELWEETGFKATEMTLLHSFFLAPGILDEEMFLFHASELRAGSPQREPDEEIENVVMSWQEALTLVRNKEIQDAKTIVGLLTVEFARSS